MWRSGCRVGPAALAACLLSLGIPLLAAEVRADFVDVTTVALADTDYTYDRKGVSFVDFDGDGLLDICGVAEGQRAITLLRNTGSGFTNVTSGDLDFPGSGSGLTWGDYDNDGDPDLFVTIEEAPPHLLRNDGGGTFTDITSGPLTAPAHGHSTAWLDYDSDYDLDLYVANLNQPSRLFRNDGGGAFTDATVDSLGALLGNGVAVGDYDNDGDPDLYLIRFAYATKRLLRNDHGTFVDVTPPLLTDPANGNSGSWADFDNDGDLDLYVVNANASNRLFRNDGPAGFVDVTTPVIALGGHSRCATWSDFDNDGRIDLYVTMWFETNHLFLNQGAGVFTDATAGPLVGTGMAAGVASGDYDEDGDLDLYFSSYASSPGQLPLPNKLLRNDLANGNHWLEIDLEGTISNRSAIGARVTLVAGGATQIREVTGSTGTRSQNSPTVHFGLGAATQVTQLRVRWPSGPTLDTTVTSVDQRIRVIERPGVLAVDPGGAASWTRGPSLRAPAPSPTRGGSRIEYALPSAMSVALSVVDVQGRLVRRVEGGMREAGLHVANWDGRDASGVRAKPAVYLCVLETAAGRESKRLVIVP